MFKFLRHSVPTDATDSRPVPHVAPPPISVRPHSDIQRELVQVVLKDTLRRHGIPFEWLACEVHTVASGTTAEELHIQLVLAHWHELLLRYAPALEAQLLRGLDRFEPAVEHAKKCHISWRFAPECGCPFTVLPPPVVWSHAAAEQTVEEEAPSILDRRQKKRPPKAAGVDPKPTTPAMQAMPRRDNDAGDYERTELSPFR